MKLSERYFLFRDGRIHHQFLGQQEMMRYIRRKLSGPKHAANKKHRWTWQRGLQ